MKKLKKLRNRSKLKPFPMATISQPIIPNMDKPSTRIFRTT